jgi:hypothetical protein
MNKQKVSTRLAQYPELVVEIEGLLDDIEQRPEATLEEVEELLLEQVRRLGREVLKQRAERMPEVTPGQGWRREVKKNCAGPARSGG